MIDVMTAWDGIKTFGVAFVLFLAVALLIAGVLMPRANHAAIIASHQGIIAKMQETIDLLRADRDGWRQRAEKSADTQATMAASLALLTTAVDRVREAVAMCQMTGGRK